MGLWEMNSSMRSLREVVTALFFAAAAVGSAPAAAPPHATLNRLGVAHYF